MSGTWANVAVAAAILLAGLSTLLMVLGLVAFARVRSSKLLMIALAFAAFAAQGVYLAWLAYERRADVASGSAGEFPVLAVSSLAIVVLLYMAVLKR
ncbi:MAG: hypothetical protein V4510_04230 [bacterium]